MVMTHPGPNSKVSPTCLVVVFSVGNRRMAVKAEEVGGVWPWVEATLIPSGTAHIRAVMRRGDDVLPVFDLAEWLHVQVQGVAPLCLIVKRQDGPMAVCIDADIPTLQTIDASAIKPSPNPGSEEAGLCQIGSEEIPLYSLLTLGLGAPAGQYPNDYDYRVGVQAR
jgi:chemotaxis signal transduction protein